MKALSGTEKYYSRLLNSPFDFRGRVIRAVKDSSFCLDVISKISQYVLPGLRSNIFAYAHYRNRKYTLASRTMRNNRTLSLVVDYSLSVSDYELNMLFDKNYLDIIDNIYRFPYDFIFDFIRLKGNSYYHEHLAKHGERKNMVKAIYMQLLFSYYIGAPFGGDKSSAEIIKAMMLADKKVQGKHSVENYFLQQIADTNLQYKGNEYLSEESFKNILSLTNSASDKERSAYVLRGLLRYADKAVVLDYLNNHYKDLVVIFGNAFVYNIVYQSNDRELYLKYFFLLKKYNVDSCIKYLYFRKSYLPVYILVRFCEIVRADDLVGKSLYLVFLLLIEYRPEYAIHYINVRKSRGANINSYGVLTKLFVGDVRGAEVERGKIESSLKHHINTYYNKNVLTFDQSKGRVLIVAEQGVADEVRWARLYRCIPADWTEITISCDPRFTLLFSRSFSKINFVAHKRHFRKPASMTSRDFHEKNIPKECPEYDLIMSTSSLFELLPDYALKTSNDAYILPEKNDDIERCNDAVLRVGLLWSSSLQIGFRGDRYGIDGEAYSALIENLKSVQKAEFYCLQSPMTESDHEMCIVNGVNIVENVDLYNDFDGSATFLSTLDFVIGPSSLLTELAAAVGTTFLHIANAPEILMMRNGSTAKRTYVDQLSNSSVTIYPKEGYVGRSRNEINKDCISHALEYILHCTNEKIS